MIGWRNYFWQNPSFASITCKVLRFLEWCNFHEFFVLFCERRDTLVLFLLRHANFCQSTKLRFCLDCPDFLEIKLFYQKESFPEKTRGKKNTRQFNNQNNLLSHYSLHNKHTIEIFREYSSKHSIYTQSTSAVIFNLSIFDLVS